MLISSEFPTAMWCILKEKKKKETPVGIQFKLSFFLNIAHFVSGVISAALPAQQH